MEELHSLEAKQSLILEGEQGGQSDQSMMKGLGGGKPHRMLVLMGPVYFKSCTWLCGSRNVIFISLTQGNHQI